jgi:hypothetical protein
MIVNSIHIRISPQIAWSIHAVSGHSARVIFDCARHRFFFMKTADHLREIARKFSTLHGQENLPKF